MRKLIMTMAATLSLSASVAQDINLPKPIVNQPSMSVTEALATRHSVREYSSEPLTLQELSNLCWAAFGVSRDNEHRTAPTARNMKEIRLYAITEQGAYEYLPVENTLKLVAKGDHRRLVAGGKGFSQDFVLKAPVSLLMVIDFNLFGQQDEKALMMGCVDAGNVSENINLYCQAVGLATVPRATMDTDALRNLLGLTDKQLPIMNNTVGYESSVDRFFTSEGNPVIMHCIKHGSLSIQVGGKWIYIDPVTDKVPPVTDYTKMPKADYIIITHEHQDHLDAKAIAQLTKDDTKIILNPRSSEILGGVGVEMKNGDKFNVDGYVLEAVPAYNNSADKQNFHPKGRDNGYVINVEGMRIYIAGDTEDIPEMANLGNIDIAFLPCNLPFTMSPEQLAKAASVVKPKVLFPYHYGQTDIQQVQKLLENLGIDARIRQYL